MAIASRTVSALYSHFAGQPQNSSSILLLFTGIFEPLFPFAKAKGLRIICVNRRSYPGSTPYTADEMDIIHNGSDEAHALFLREQGVFLALFVDGIIRRHSLQPEGGIALVAWSMGNFFALCILDSLQYLPLDTKARLSAYVHTYIAWGERPI